MLQSRMRPPLDPGSSRAWPTWDSCGTCDRRNGLQMNGLNETINFYKVFKKNVLFLTLQDLSHEADLVRLSVVIVELIAQMEERCPDVLGLLRA